MNLSLLSLGVLGLSGALFLLGSGDEDRKGVERAVLDYVEAIEQAKPEWIERSVHPDLAKFGFSRGSADGEWRHHPMTFDGLVKLAREMKALGHVPENAQHEVQLLDVMDKTASAKLSAFWGVDYMHLAKYDGKWKIVQVLWQSRPVDEHGEDHKGHGH